MELQTDKRQQRTAYCLEVYGISQLPEQCDALAVVMAVVVVVVGAVLGWGNIKVAARVANVIELMTARRASGNFDGLRMLMTKKRRQHNKAQRMQNAVRSLADCRTVGQSDNLQAEQISTRVLFSLAIFAVIKRKS